MNGEDKATDRRWQDKSRDVRPVGFACKYLSARRFEQPATAPRDVPRRRFNQKGGQNQGSSRH
jgi:hypothetical protein